MQQQSTQHQFIIFADQPKINTRVARQNLSEHEAAWMENLQPIAGNRLKIVPAPLPVPTAVLPGKTVSRMFHAALLADPLDPTGPLIDYTIFFATDGSGTAIDATTGAVIPFAPPGTFSLVPDMTTWSDERILIIDPLAGYCSWDGVTFIQGVTATRGTTIAVHRGRVWIANRRTLTWTGTAGFADTDPLNAAGFTQIQDADLVHEITALRALNNFLYIFGDSSIKQIGDIAIQNPPAGTVGISTTIFQIVTLASDIGTWFMMTIISYNRLVVFANKQGVYWIAGASVKKVSDDLDGIFQNIDWSQEPCAAVADISNNHCYLLLVRYIDKDNDQVFGVQPQQAPLTRSLILVLQTSAWWTAQQGMNLISICSMPLQATEEIEVYGSSGSDITWLLDDEEGEVQFILKTALSAHNNIIVAKRCIRAGIALSAEVPQRMTFEIVSENQTNSYTLEAARDITWRNDDHDTIDFKNDSGETLYFMTAPGFKLPFTSADSYGHVLGANAFAKSKLLSINSVNIEYSDADLWGIPP
ncbi:MAG: hypothetical protein J2P16_00590 [Mycobacterium sp.]|nr:hypothetical protein [Mycobacterium sp.]